MTLSNCYKPLPFRLLQAKQEKGSSSTTKPTPRDCGNGQARSNHGLRLLRMETGITSASGSALVELGHTKVLCEVIGPTPDAAIPNSTTTINMEEGTMDCQVQYLPHVGFPITSLVGGSASGLSDTASINTAQQQQQPSQPTTGRINTQIGVRERELASQLLSSLSAAVPLQSYPKNTILLQITILQDDGSALSACTVAASLALVNSSIELYDIVTSSTVAIHHHHQGGGTTVGDNDDTTTTTSARLLLADPTHEEMVQASATVTLSLLANWKEVTLWNQSGRLSSSVANEAISLCKDGCRTMHKFMRNALLLEEEDDEKL